MAKSNAAQPIMLFNKGKLQPKERGKVVAHCQVENVMLLGVA
jgi:hypothetical protein